MSLKITAKILLAITQLVAGVASLEIVLFFSTLTPIATAQNIYSPTSIPRETVNQATKLSQQGKAKAEVQDYRGALADLSQAIQLNPNEADFYYQRGLILVKLSDRQAAVRDFDDAILRDPNHAWAYLHRGGIALNLGSSYQIADYRGFNYQITQVIGDRGGDAQAMLDLRTARDLFAQQGDREGYKTANRLIQHFGTDIKQKANQDF
ncbi:MAG TPA: tetratricopeptide repeat protein [Coleofasciculaceae cyanobacterium]|jgi:tetratricopeptide (TPR) repeat protein